MTKTLVEAIAPRLLGTGRAVTLSARALFTVLIISAPFLVADQAAAAETKLAKLETKLKTVAPSPNVAAAATAVQSLPSPIDGFALRTELPSVRFDFDKYAIRPGDGRILDANAEWLKGHPDYSVVLEGGADPRGTRDYNLDLAEKRAMAVRDYLMARGVSATQVKIITSGELKRACAGKEETCWSVERRVDFWVKTLVAQSP